jgi:hypothetical protein
MIEQQDTVPAPVFQALAMAFYCLHDTLVSKGALDEGEVGYNLSRMRSDDPMFAETLQRIRNNLDSMPFRPQSGPSLRLVETKEAGDNG